MTIRTNQRSTRVLLVEDEVTDQMAFRRFVRSEKLPYECSFATSVGSAKALLSCTTFDVIVTDYSLGDGNAIDVFDSAAGVPGIIVTGAGDEETAVRGMKAGAYDYILKDAKGLYLWELPRAILLAIRQKEWNGRLQMLSQAMMSIGDSVYITDTADRIVFVNRAFCLAYGYDEKEVVGTSSDFLWQERPGSDRSAESEETTEVSHVRRAGESFLVSLTRSQVKDEAGRTVAVVRVARDVTERHRALLALRAANEELEKSREALVLLATRDDLTGLFNRREMNRLLADEVARCRRSGRPVSVLMVDVDHFKAVNDTYGHAVGDEVLRVIAELTRNSVRTIDRPARYGGEELAVILPETAENDARVVAERLRCAVHTHSFVALDSAGGSLALTVTVSIGIASLSRDQGTPDELLRAADSALYSAKRQGRNRTVTAGDQSDSERAGSTM